MVRICGVFLSDKLDIYRALTQIYGIGYFISKKILTSLKINLNTKVTKLSFNNIVEIRKYIELNQFKVEGELKKIVSLNIKNLININCYKGKRHIRSLPVHGQRTRTNSRTVRRKINFIHKR